MIKPKRNIVKGYFHEILHKFKKKTDTSQINLCWSTINRQCVLQTRVMDVYMQSAASPEGIENEFVVMDAPDWVITIPLLDAEQAKNEYGINEPCFLMVSQWRHGIEQLSLEFPGGVIDKGEEPNESAKRELLEETGYRTENLIFLGTMSPNPAIFSNKVHFFAAKNLVNTKQLDLDDDEFVSTTAIAVSEVCKKMGQSPYTHALMGTALHLYCQQSEK